jgi:predicted dehydrogenase
MQAAWRSDPKQAGAAGCMGDIGTHAANLAEYVTGLRIQELCAELTRFVKDRRLEDDGNCLLRFNQGARGVLIASQVSIGHQNDIGLQVYGENGAIEWHEEHPEELYVKRLNAPIEIWRRGNGYVADRSPAAARATRLPAGHPEAFIEAFANVYANFADTLRCRLTRTRPDPLMTDFPDVDDGLRGMQFIAAVVKSAKLGAKWVKIGK